MKNGTIKSITKTVAAMIQIFGLEKSGFEKSTEIELSSGLCAESGCAAGSLLDSELVSCDKLALNSGFISGSATGPGAVSLADLSNSILFTLMDVDDCADFGISLSL